MRRASIMTTGSNGEPVGPRRDRVNRDHERTVSGLSMLVTKIHSVSQPHLDDTNGDRGGATEPTRHEDTRQSPVCPYLLVLARLTCLVE